jgi:hypothetical protein
VEREAAFRVLGVPATTFRIHGSKNTIGPDGWMHIKLAQIYPEEDADIRGFAYEWACGGAPPGTACIAEEFDGEFTLVMVCSIHGAKP